MAGFLLSSAGNCPLGDSGDGDDGDFGILLSCKLDAPVPCRLDAPDFDVARWGSADCLHQHQQVI